MRQDRTAGFTLVELTVAMSLIGLVAGALFAFTSVSSRLIARNLSTNHSHETSRLSSQSLLSELRDSGSGYRLVNFDGTSYSDVASVGTSEVDKRTSLFVGTRANAVRYRELAAGPLKLTANTTSSSTTLTFDFVAGNPSNYRPVTGDKVLLPLINKEFEITAVSGAFTPAGTVTVTPAIGFTLNIASPNVITGLFYRRVAFSVANNELRFHPNFNGTAKSTYRVLRSGITSPKPFSLLFPTAGAIYTDGMHVRVSLEVTDLDYSARRYATQTTTLYTVYSPRVQPPALSSSQ